MSKYYLGIMCGTSLDSIDISIINAAGKKFKVFGFQEYQLSQKFKNKINGLKSSKPTTTAVNNFNAEITTLIIGQVKNILKKYRLDKSDISAIGYAGITLDHRPDLKKSLYLGNPNIVCSWVVSIFAFSKKKAQSSRRSDLATLRRSDQCAKKT